MTPFVFALLAFLFTIANRLYSKYALFRLDGYGLAILSNIIGAIIVLPFVYTQLPTIFEFTYIQAALILLAGILWTYVAWAGNLSIAQNNFSFKEIIRQTRIIWVVLAGIFILNEQLGIHEIIGIVMILASVYIISFRTFSFREHISSKPILLAWSVAFMAAAIAFLEKVILNSTPVLVYAFLAYVLPAFFLCFFLNQKRMGDVRFLLKTHLKELLIVSVLMALSYYTALSAYQLLPISIAYPFIQSSTAVGVLIGTFLFEENRDWKRKLLAAVVAIAGILVIKGL
jgi:drug/metabolite transporter (DMT)-like permease